MKKLFLWVSLIVVCLQSPVLALNSIYGLVSDGIFAEYDLDTNTKNVLRMDVHVSADNRSTYDPTRQRFFSNTNDSLQVIDIVSNTKSS